MPLNKTQSQNESYKWDVSLKFVQRDAYRKYIIFIENDDLGVEIQYMIYLYLKGMFVGYLWGVI